MIKLIASDLDGTIIGDKNSIPLNNLKAINVLKENHIPLVICTGKTYALSKDICQSLGASFGIFGNGSQIINLRTGQEISKKALSLEEIKSCFSILENYNLHIHAYSENSIITPKLLYMDLRNSILFPNKVNFEIVPSILEYISKKNLQIFKLIISSPNSLTSIKELIHANKNISVNHIFKTGIYKDKIIDKEYEYLDVSPANVTKGNALKFLSNYLNLEKDNILSIGDNLNDIDMFKVSSNTVAVHNAHEYLKNIAGYITSNSAENAGFAEAIHKFIPFL